MARMSNRLNPLCKPFLKGLSRKLRHLNQFVTILMTKMAVYPEDYYTNGQNAISSRYQIKWVVKSIKLQEIAQPSRFKRLSYFSRREWQVCATLYASRF